MWPWKRGKDLAYCPDPDCSLSTSCPPSTFPLPCSGASTSLPPPPVLQSPCTGQFTGPPHCHLWANAAVWVSCAHFHSADVPYIMFATALGQHKQHAFLFPVTFLGAQSGVQPLQVCHTLPESSS